MNFKKWVKSIQTAGYNGARTVYISYNISFYKQYFHKKHILEIRNSNEETTREQKIFFNSRAFC